MMNVNRGRELGCPMCPKVLRYVTSRSADGSVHHKGDRFKTVTDIEVYECASHGPFHVGPNGRLQAGR